MAGKHQVVTNAARQTRRRFLGAVATTCGGLIPSAAGGLAGQPTGGQRPNVIIVLTDDQGYGDLSCQGNPILKTPNLDRLHDQSVRLTDFHVAPVCSPTRGAILTGRDCLATGAYRAGAGQTFIRRDVATIAEIFAANGYRTGHFGKWHLGDNYPHRPQDRGFEETVHHKGFGVGSGSDYWNNDYFDDKYWHNDTLTQYKGYCTDVWFSEAKRWIQVRRDRGDPFFAYIATNAPHSPLYVPDRYRQPYSHLPHDIASYFGMIANIDENMGALEAFLARAGLRDNTILIFLSDNGGRTGVSVFSAGMRGQKTGLYEGGHRVPCFVRWPGGGLRSPGDVDALTQCQDLAPTLAGLCGLKVKENTPFDGVSLARLLRGHEQPEMRTRMLVVQYGRHSPSQVLPVPPVTKWDCAVLWNKWRLINGTELYDLGSDPAQETNLSLPYADELGQMRRHYEKWWSGVQPFLRPVPITVGSSHENPARLTSEDWYEVPFNYAFYVRRGARRNGFWNIRVETAGEYEISLRRWPREADTAIDEGLPPHPLPDRTWGSLEEGRSLPITRARLKIGDQEQSQPVRKGDKAVVFRLRLNIGETRMQTWFHDSAGQELCGAWYTDVRRLSPV